MAKKPIPTTESPRHQLQQLFQENAKSSFANAIELLNAKGLFERVLKQLKEGQDLTDELLELKSVSKAQALQILEQLIKDSESKIQAAWALDPRYAKLFKSSLRIRSAESELFPRFDVEHCADTADGEVVVSIMTDRRVVNVNISGNEAAQFNLSGRLVMSGLR